MVDGRVTLSEIGTRAEEPAWWTEARSLKRRGMTDREVAAAVGKALSATQHALRPKARARALAYQREARADGGLVAENIKRRMRREHAPKS
jgi:hypothetical protein